MSDLPLLGRTQNLLRKYPSVLIAIAMLISIVLVYWPYRKDMTVIYKFWDGPLYMYVANNFYNVPAQHPFEAYKLPTIYFASHLPLYPLLIRVLSWFTFGNFPTAMLLATSACSIVAAILFFRMLQAWNVVTNPFWTAFLFCFLPPRWVLYHSAGAAEPLFLCLVFSAFLALQKNNTGLVIVFILLASLTKIIGALLIPVFAIIYLTRKQWKDLGLIPLAGLGIVGLFVLYQFVYGDFFAYFRWNASEHKIIDLRPFEIFRLYASKVNFHSTELYLLTYVLYGLGTFALWKHKEFFIYSLAFFLFHCFVFHLDLSRYLVVVAPFALLIGFDSILSKRSCRWVLPLVWYLEYIYVWGWLPLNAASDEVYQRLLSELAR